MLETNKIYQGDVLKVLKTFPDESVHCCVTSPPYWGLRDYGVEGQLGLESTPEEYVTKMVEVFREVKRVLKKEGTLWLNLGDSYAGSGKGAWGNKEVQKEIYVPDKDSPQCKLKKVPQGLKPKDLVGIPWMVAFALRADGWYLRQDIIWHKPNAMPESVKDRCTKAHEYIFLLSKNRKYYYDYEAVKEPLSIATVNDLKSRKTLNNKGTHGGTRKDLGRNRDEYVPKDGKRNKRTVWTVTTKPFKGAHFAVFPEDLIEPCILAGTSPQACEICGAPWERVVEREPMEIKRSGRGEALGKYGKTAASGTMIKPATSVTTGWKPTCTCQNEGKGRCIVLDPFMGSGTTAVVALKHNRNYIGIELNPEYIKIAEKRISETTSNQIERQLDWLDDLLGVGK